MLSAASVKKQTLCATVIRIPLVHDNASGLRGDGFTESAGALFHLVAAFAVVYIIYRR